MTDPTPETRCLGCEDFPPDEIHWTPMSWCHPGPGPLCMATWDDKRCQGAL